MKKIKAIYQVEKPENQSKHWEHLIGLAWLMNHENRDHAIKLQLENLILTYGLDNVQKQFNNVRTIKKAG